MRKALIRVCEWLIALLNKAYHSEREWMDGEEQDEWFTQRRELYDGLKKSRKNK